MLGINTNNASILSQNNLKASSKGFDTTIQRLSSGLRVNSAKDDAAGLAIATKMSSKIRGLEQANRNVNDGISYLQVADNAMGKITDSLQRMRELAVQAETGTLNATDRSALDKEYQQLSEEVERVVTSTSFNGNTIFDQQSVSIQAGAEATDDVQLNLEDVGDGSGNSVATALGGAGGGANVAEALGGIDSTANSTAAIATLDNALGSISSIRATVGASSSRLDAIVAANETSIQSESAARGRILDADFAKETANLTRIQILQQAGTAMLAQANQAPNNVLSLLR